MLQAIDFSKVATLFFSSSAPGSPEESTRLQHQTMIRLMIEQFVAHRDEDEPARENKVTNLELCTLSWQP